MLVEREDITEKVVKVFSPFKGDATTVVGKATALINVRPCAPEFMRCRIESQRKMKRKIQVEKQ